MRRNILFVQRTRGYVLLMTLLLIPVAGIALASVARMSIDSVIRAQHEGDALQQRWGAITLRQSIFPRAQDLLAIEEEASHLPIRSLSGHIQLGKAEFVWVISDEQSKANLNSLYARRDDGQLEQILQQYMNPNGADSIRLRPSTPRPTPNSRSPILFVRAFDSVGQVMENYKPVPVVRFGGVRESGGSDHNDIPRGGLWNELTIWGDGRLNVHRASAEVLQDFCSPYLGEADVQRILTIRQESPDIRLNKLLDRLDLSLERREVVSGLLTDRSLCHAMWVVSRVNKATRYELAVSLRSDSQSNIPGWILWTW